MIVGIVTGGFGLNNRQLHNNHINDKKQKHSANANTTHSKPDTVKHSQTIKPIEPDSRISSHDNQKEITDLLQKIRKEIKKPDFDTNIGMTLAKWTKKLKNLNYNIAPGLSDSIKNYRVAAISLDKAKHLIHKAKRKDKDKNVKSKIKYEYRHLSHRLYELSHKQTFSKSQEKYIRKISYELHRFEKEFLD